MTKDERCLLDEKYSGVATPSFDADCDRLAKGEPVAYLIGHQPFLGLTIHLNTRYCVGATQGARPLIPRPETEWWVQQLLNTIAPDSLACHSTVALRSVRPTLTTDQRSAVESPVALLDLCAGSGAIGCAALAHLPETHVYFGEIDPAHKATIERNICENHLDESRAHIGIGDLFEPFGDIKFDIIAANPPYIPINRKLDASVTDYEPALALRSGEDGLDLIRRIASELPKHLTSRGIAHIECDSAHAAAACALFIDRGMHARIHTDQYERPRVIVVKFQ